MVVYDELTISDLVGSIDTSDRAPMPASDTEARAALPPGARRETIKKNK